jgi:hypothetical protein
MVTYLALEDIDHAAPSAVKGTTSAITSAVKLFIGVLTEGQRPPEPDLPESLSSGCTSFVTAALRFQHKIKSQTIFSDYRLHCYQNGATVPRPSLRFARNTPRLGGDQVKIACPVSLGLWVLEADGNGKPPKVHWLRGVEVAIEQDFS